MKKFITNNWKALLFFTITGLVGGFFVGIYLLDSYPPEIKQQVVEQGFNSISLGVVGGIQYAGYGLILGALGILLAEKIGLWKNEWSITKKPLVASIIVAIIGGLAIILPDILFFGHHSPEIMDTYAAKPTIAFILGGVICGGVTEEVMMRLFLMSLFAFILHKLFGKKNDKVATWVLAISNIAAALLFAAGHLPTTYILFGLSPMIIFRCFLLNGGVGLLFGYLYRKYGLRYAMIAHGGCHIVSKLIWFLFI